MNEAETKGEIRALAAERRLPQSHLEQWLARPFADAFALLEAARTLKLRTGQIQSARELLTEIAARERIGFAAVLRRDELRLAINASGSAPQRARAFLDGLRAIRYPRLRAALDALRAQIVALSLPRGITIILPKDLSSDEVRIELQAHSGPELTKMIDALKERAGEIQKIVEQAVGGDEV